jgi:hypothetical protein
VSDYWHFLYAKGPDFILTHTHTHTHTTHTHTHTHTHTRLPFLAKDLFIKKCWPKSVLPFFGQQYFLSPSLTSHRFFFSISFFLLITFIIHLLMSKSVFLGVHFFIGKKSTSACCTQDYIHSQHSLSLPLFLSLSCESQTAVLKRASTYLNVNLFLYTTTHIHRK